jgi:hypothetical protein
MSYAREDATIAKKLYYDLKAVGVVPWLDVIDLLPGERWKPAISRAILNSTYFLALLSSSSVNKRGYVQRELRQALDILGEFPDSEVFLIPVRLDECRPVNEELSELNWVDLFPAYEAGVERILSVLLRTEASQVEPGQDGVGKAEETVVILLVRGEAPTTGAPIFAYVAVRADRAPAFMEAQSSEVFHPEDFGVIIESGEGEPSAEIQEMMEREYGFDHRDMVDIPDVSTATSIVDALGRARND